MKISKSPINLIRISSLLGTALVPFFASAQDPEPLINNVDQIQPIVEKIVGWMAGIFWVVAVGAVIWGAFLFLAAGGDEKKVEDGKKILLYAVIAAIVALLANGIKAIVKSIVAV